MRWLLVIAALAACGADTETRSKIAAPEAPGDAGLPPPSCAVAINEFLWAVEVHEPVKVRDALVGECINDSWTASERRCVAAARDAGALRGCEITSRVAIVLGSKSPGAELGIAECDELLARYRQCMIPSMLPQVKADTEEALDESLAIWRAELAKPGGPERIQTMCVKLAKSLERPMAQQDCEAK